MACIPTALAGSALDCGSIGGLRKLHLAHLEEVVTTSATITDGAISGITMAAGKDFAEYDFRNGNANFVSTGNVDDAAGTSFVETVISLQLNKMDAAKQVEMSNMFGKPLYAIAEDQNGLKWFIGYGSYGYANVVGQSGANKGDSNNFTVTITAQTTAFPYVIASVPVSA